MQLALAGLRTATDAPEVALALLAEVRMVCAPLGARPTLARADALAERLAGPAPVRHPAGLSEREVEVLRLVAWGLTNAKISAELSISPRTVQQHLTNLYGKLAVSSRAAATRFAVEYGLA
ncbi:MAG: hypothetical protein H0U10_17350 [Chloroflexia bacterium]|nr:hypothetical protein [Chloroflexia bacterium]